LPGGLPFRSAEEQAGSIENGCQHRETRIEQGAEENGSNDPEAYKERHYPLPVPGNGFELSSSVGVVVPEEILGKAEKNNGNSGKGQMKSNSSSEVAIVDESQYGCNERQEKKPRQQKSHAPQKGIVKRERAVPFLSGAGKPVEKVP
jgi:hypothetical protein